MTYTFYEEEITAVLLKRKPNCRKLGDKENLQNAGRLERRLPFTNSFILNLHFLIFLVA